MYKNHEAKSLLEVREWKDQCREEDISLSPQAYLEKIKTIAEKIKLMYHIQLQKVSRDH